VGGSKRVTVGHRYYLGMHMVLCHGPIDYIEDMRVDKRVAWSGKFSGGSAAIFREGLFGGEDREGGVSGVVDILNGGPTQAQNVYLQFQLGFDIPAFRGVTSVVLNQCYLGLNPYLKPWSFKASRVHTTENGDTQWYDAKAAVAKPYERLIGEDGTWVDYFREVKINTYYWSNPYDYIVEEDSNGERYADIGSNGISTKGYVDVNGTYVIFAGRLKFPDLNIGQTVTITFDDGLRTYTLVYTQISASSVSVSWTITNVDPGDTDTPLFGSGVVGDSDSRDWIDFEVIYVQGPPQSVGFDFGCADGGANYLYVPASIGANENVSISIVPSDSIHVSEIRVGPEDFVLSGDMNPIHIIRECLTNSAWGMGYLAADIDDTNFQAAADQLFTESMGMSLLWDRQTRIEDFIPQIIRHINAALYVDRTNGKFAIKLIRDDYSLGSLITLDESNILKVSDYSRVDLGDAVNSITVNFWDSTIGETGSITADDPALIQQHGGVIGNTIQYPGFTNSAIAYRAAARDLRSLSFPLLSCTIEANRDAASLNIGDVFKFEWPDYHDGYVVMRVMQIGFGDGRQNKVRITATEDIFRLPSQPYIAPEESGWKDIGGDPIESDVIIAEETPYYELVQIAGQTTVDNQLTSNPETGYLAVAAKYPDYGLNAQLWVNDGSGYDNKSVLEFAPTCELAEDLPAASSGSVVVSITYENDIAMDIVEAGTFAQVNDEILEIVSVNTDTNTLTLGRGLLDTVISNHSSGDTVVFWDRYAGSDEIEYVDGETINVKVLTNSANGTLDVATASANPVVMDSRAIRPYLPAQFKINSSYFPEYIDGQTAFSISWVHRDRTQQTSGTFYDFLDASIGPETNTTYEIDLYDETGTFVKTVTGETGTSWSWSSEAEDSEIEGGVESSYQDVVTAAGPTAYWNLDESSGTDIVDSIGGYDGTYYGSPTLGEDPLVLDGTSVTFDGSNYGSIPDNAALRPGTGEYAIEFWLNATTATSYGMIFGKFENFLPYAGPTIFFNWNGGSAGAGYITLRDSATAGYWVASITSGLNDNVSRHYVLQRRLTSSGPDVYKLELYINGVLDNSTTLSTVVDHNNSNDINFLSRVAAGQYVVGTFDEFAYYVGSALTPSQVLDHYQARYGSGGASYRLNGQIRAVLKSKRDGYYSRANYDVTVRREGYGFQYGYFYGGGS